MLQLLFAVSLLAAWRTEEPAATQALSIELPPGPLREAVAKLDPNLEPSAPPEGFGPRGKAPGLASEALLDATTWVRWNRALAALRKAGASGEASETNARAVLALVALEQGRFRDANEHLAQVARDPALFAALLPRFVPGVPAGTALARGGRAADLADGCVLTPALPPASAEPGAKRALVMKGLAIGTARVDLTVSVEHEGVQAELALTTGERARVGIVLPRVEEYAIGAEYVDWERQPKVGAPLFVDARAGEEPHVFFARFDSKDPQWPTRIPEGLPAAVVENGLWIVLGPREPERERWAKLAEALAMPELGIACRLASVGAPVPGGITVDLADPAQRMEKLAWLVAALERFALRAR